MDVQGITAAALKQPHIQSSPLPATAVDHLLSSQPHGATWLQQAAAQDPQGPLQIRDTSEMFLRPAQLPAGEKVLRIVDFVDSIIPRDEEHILSNVGTTKIYVSHGRKKIKLEQVSFQQWVIANTRIFYALLSSRKLPSMSDLQHYLAYTVKVMELSSKYSWVSVLRYDDEFRQIQAVYNYPWNYDSNHLHTVILEPLISTHGVQGKVGGLNKPGSQVSTTANFTNDGHVICRNFNRQKGCALQECSFSHSCNRKINGKACGANHPAHQHPMKTSLTTSISQA